MKSCAFQVRGSLLSFNSIMSLKRKGLFILISSEARQVLISRETRKKVLLNEVRQVLISSEARKKVLPNEVRQVLISSEARKKVLPSKAKQVLIK